MVSNAAFDLKPESNRSFLFFSVIHTCCVTMFTYFTLTWKAVDTVQPYDELDTLRLVLDCSVLHCQEPEQAILGVSLG